MNPTRSQILSLSDAGHPPDAIAHSLALSPTTVYAVLREHRPARPRKVRARTSDLPYRIRGLRGCGIKPARIAVLLGCSRAYVYRILGEPIPPPPY